MFSGFEPAQLPTPRGDVHAVIGGEGPPVLLLHGFPETHLMWHAVAPVLAARFTVIAADLPGYGGSFRPVASPDHAPHSKRAMAADLVAAMESLGYENFALVGHDRGGRVSYRLALDHPERVTRLATVDIIPTGEVWARADRTFALGYWHFGFMAQDAPLPERLLLGDPEAFFDHVCANMNIDSLGARYLPEALDAYRAALTDPDAVSAMCEEYRASATIDCEIDASGGQITCPLLVLWGSRGSLPAFYGDVLEIWRPWARELRGQAIDAGHYVPEDAPEATAEALLTFLLESRAG